MSGAVLAKIFWQYSKLFLKTFGKIGRRVETDNIAYFIDSVFSGLNQLGCHFQPFQLNKLIGGNLSDSLYFSMQAGDNVYFLSDRRIYGVGKLVNVGIDCKYKNFLDANIFERKEKVVEADQPLMQLGPEYRWLCLFEPDQQFFAEGVDMDEVLSYRPSAFRMLRAFQDVTFIKIDDEENRALKECIYLKNRDKQKYFEYSTSEHERILRFDLEKYRINPEETIIKEFNYEKNEINTEMLLEAWMIDFISKNGFEGEKYDYVTHQVIASPFKPLAYIDKMDIFAYRYLEDFPDTEKERLLDGIWFPSMTEVFQYLESYTS